MCGDAYAKGWCRTAFARHGIDYTENAPIKSDICLHCVALFTANQVVLPDNPRLIQQLCGLRHKVGQGGKETVDHLRNGHDDIANAVCGVLYRLSPTWSMDAVAVPPIIVSGPLIAGFETPSPENVRTPRNIWQHFTSGRTSNVAGENGAGQGIPATISATSLA